MAREAHISTVKTTCWPDDHCAVTTLQVATEQVTIVATVMHKIAGSSPSDMRNLSAASPFSFPCTQLTTHTKKRLMYQREEPILLFHQKCIYIGLAVFLFILCNGKTECHSSRHSTQTGRCPHSRHTACPELNAQFLHFDCLFDKGFLLPGLTTPLATTFGHTMFQFA